MTVLIAFATFLVVPFATKGEAPPASGIAVAESILDVVVQGKTENFLTLKQLDAVLRRRDLRLADPGVPGSAIDLGKALGATEVITGELWLNGGKWVIDARMIHLPEGTVVRSSKVEGARAALPGLAQQAGIELVGGTVQPLMTGSTAALEAAARCWAELARQSLGAHSKMTLSGEHLAIAEKACKEAVKADPRFGLGRAGVAVTLAVRGKFKEARVEAQKAQEIRVIPVASLAEAFAARKARDIDGWRQVLQNAVAERPGFLHALGYLAEDAMESGDDKEALALFDQYLQRSPQHTWAMGKKAREMAKLGQTDEAIELSEKALGMNPGDPELLIETASRY